MRDFTKIFRKKTVALATAFIFVVTLISATAGPAAAGTGIGYGGGTGASSGGSTWVASPGWASFVATSGQSATRLNTIVSGLRSDGANLLYQCQNSQLIWYLRFNGDGRFSGGDPGYFVGGYTADYPAQQMKSPGGASYDILTTSARWNVALTGAHTTNTVLICSKDINAETTWKTQTLSDTKTNHASNTFFGPANLNTQVTRQPIQGTTTDPIGVANLHDQPKVSSQTPFGTYLQSLASGSLSSQTAYNTINNTLLAAPYSASLTSSPSLSSALTYRVNANMDRPDVTLDDANQKGLAEGGVLNISQFDDYGYVTTTQDDTFSYNFTWRCAGSPSNTWPGITKEGSLVGGGAAQIVGSEAAASSAISGGYNGWACYVSSGTRPSDFANASTANGWTLGSQNWNLSKAPTSQLSAAFYQIMTVHCNKEDYDALIASLGTAGSDYVVLNQSIGIDNSITAMIRTKVYTGTTVTPPDDPAGKRQAADQLKNNWMAAQAIADAQATLATSRENAASAAEGAADGIRPATNPNYAAANTALTSTTSTYATASQNFANSVDSLKSKITLYKAAADIISGICYTEATTAQQANYTAAYGDTTSGYVKAYNDYIQVLVYEPGTAPDNIPGFSIADIDTARTAYEVAEATLKTAITGLMSNCSSIAGAPTLADFDAGATTPVISNLVFDSSGNIYWISSSGRLMKYNGTSATVFAIVGSADNPRLLLDSSGTFSVVEDGSYYRVTSAGIVSSVALPATSTPTGGNIASVSNGDIYWPSANPSGANLGLVKYSGTSTVVSSGIPTANGAITSMAAIGSDVYVLTGNKLWKINPVTGISSNVATVTSAAYIAAAPDGKIYAAHDDGSIDVYDPSTNTKSLSGYNVTAPMTFDFSTMTMATGGVLYSAATNTTSSPVGSKISTTSGPTTSAEQASYQNAVAAKNAAKTLYDSREATMKTTETAAVIATCNLDTILMMGKNAAYPACDSTHTSAPGTMAQPSTPAQNCAPTNSYGCRVTLAASIRADAVVQRTEATRLQGVAQSLQAEYVTADTLATAAEASTWGFTPADPALSGLHRDLGDQLNPIPAKAKTGLIGFYDKECTVACTSSPVSLDNSLLTQAYQNAQNAEAAALAAKNAAAAASTGATTDVATATTNKNNATSAYETARANAVIAANALRNFITQVPTGSGGNGYKNLTTSGNTSSAQALALSNALNTYSSYYGTSGVVNPNPKTSESTSPVSIANAFKDGSADSINGDTSALVSNPNSNIGAGGTAAQCGSNSKISVCVYLYETGDVNLAANQSLVNVRVYLQNRSQSYRCDPGGSVSGGGIVGLGGGIAGLDRAADNACSADPATIYFVNGNYWVTHDSARGGSISQSVGFSWGAEGGSGYFGSASTSATLGLRTLAPASVSVKDGVGATGVSRVNSFLNTDATFASAYATYSAADTAYTNAVSSNAAAIANYNAASTAYDNAVAATAAAKAALDKAPQTATGATVVGPLSSYPGNRAVDNASISGNLPYKNELGGVLIDKATTNPVVNSNYLEIYRDNKEHTLSVNVSYPDTTANQTTTGKQSLLYRGQAPITTSVVLWNMSTPNTTPAASQFLINAADSSGVNKAPLLTGTTDPSSVAQRNFSKPGNLDTYNGLLASSVAGFYNNFNVSGTWSSTKTRPVILNVKWEYQPVNMVTVPTFVGFTSTLGVEPDSQPKDIEQAIDVRCYANFGTTGGVQPNESITFPNYDANGVAQSQSMTYSKAVQSYTGTGTANMLDSQLLEGPMNESNSVVKNANPSQNFTYSFPHDTSQAEINSGIADPDTLRASSDGDQMFSTGTNLVLKFIRSVAN